jgi:hypothetical protein
MTGRQVTNRINELSKRLFPDLVGSVGGSQLWKAVVSALRKDLNPSVSATDLATQMTHNLSTANQHYHMDDRVKQKMLPGDTWTI